MEKYTLYFSQPLIKQIGNGIGPDSEEIQWKDDSVEFEAEDDQEAEAEAQQLLNFGCVYFYQDARNYYRRFIKLMKEIPFHPFSNLP